MTFPFLSDAWLDAVAELREEYADRIPDPPLSARLNAVVSDAPFAEDKVEVHLDTSTGRTAFGRGHLSEPDVTVYAEWSVAREVFISRDLQKGMQAFLEGRIRVQGDVSRFMALQATPLDPLAGELAERVLALTEHD